MNLIAWIVGVINVIYLWCYLVFRQLVTNIFTNGVIIVVNLHDNCDGYDY